VDLAPGTYRLFLEVIDSGTDKGYRNSRAFKVESNPLHSAVKLFLPQKNVSSEIILGPDPPVIDFNQDQNCGFMLRTNNRDSLIITSKLLRMEGEKSPIVRQKIHRILPLQDITQFTEKIERKYLDEGQYLLKYRIKYNQQIINLEKYFSVVWFDKPIYLYKYDLALRPMQYMLTPEEFEYADGLSYDELGVWMKEFWQAKDPTPDTPLNEIKYQYFLRVAEANKKYSQRFTEGWETDRGKALILYGTPTRVESNRYAINKKPYEIWYYESLNRKLTFVDQNKEENYELLSVENIEETGNE
jgi:GWxTD domain-containing protein